MGGRGSGRGSLRRLLVALAAVVFLAACGGDEPTRNDAATVKLLLSSSAAVQDAFIELYGCLPEEPACYARHGSSAVSVVNAQRTRFASALDQTDDECLRDVGQLYLSSLNGYAEAAEAAAESDPDTFDAALSRTTNQEIAYNRKLSDCGFAEGRTAEIGAAIREVNVELLRLSEEIADCVRPRCVREVARRMEKSSGEGVALLRDYRDELDDAPGCLMAAVDTFLSSFRTLGRAARAIQENDFATAERDGTRAGQLAVEAQRRMADCLTSLGA